MLRSPAPSAVVQPGRHGWKPYGAAAGWILLVAVAGGLATEIGPWYRSLEQPPWKPPDWLFGPAWLTIYVLTAVSAVHAWTTAPSVARRRLLAAAYAVNAVLNVAWSVLFFSLRRPDWALWDVVGLGLSVAAVMVASRHAPRSVWLLLPYLLWVVFAGVLNAAVVDLNGPFIASPNLATATMPPVASPG